MFTGNCLNTALLQVSYNLPCAVIIMSMLQTSLFAKREIKKGTILGPVVCLEKLLLILRQPVPRSSEHSLAAVLLLFCCLRDLLLRGSSVPLSCSHSYLTEISSPTFPKVSNCVPINASAGEGNCNHSDFFVRLFLCTVLCRSAFSVQ